MAVKTSEAAFEEDVLNSDVPVLVDFYTDGCVPCRRLAPVLAEIEEESGGAFKLCKVNVNYESGLAKRLGVHSAPTLIWFSNGGEVVRRSGFIGKGGIMEIIEDILEGKVCS